MTDHLPHPTDPGTPGFSTPVGTRRNFFRWVIQLSAAVIGLGLAVPLAGYVISPALKKRAKPWVPVGNVSDLEAGLPKQLEYVTTLQDGWRKTQMRKGVWAVKQDDGSVTVYSPICTHLGCGYNWDPSARRFLCPCHGSVFDIEGRVLDGPAPRSLDVLPTRIEDGRVLVQYKEFKSGLKKSVEV